MLKPTLTGWGAWSTKVSSLRRSGPFDSTDEPSSWDSSFESNSFWIRPPSFATVVLLFWVVVFGIAMFWHRGGNPASPIADSTAELYPYGLNPYATTLPVYGYPEFDSAAVYKYFYNLYMKRLQEASLSEAAHRTQPLPAMASIPKPDPRKQEQHRASEQSEAPWQSDSLTSTQPSPASSAVPVERSDIMYDHYAQPLNLPIAPSVKVVPLPRSNLPHRALPDVAGSAPFARRVLKVAPVGLPGYERQPMVVPQGTVRSVYPEAEAAVPSSE